MATKQLSKMTPAEILKKGREMIKLARLKENELRQRSTLALGHILSREINNGFCTPWVHFQLDLEQIVGKKIERPRWSEDEIVNTTVNSDELSSM